GRNGGKRIGDQFRIVVIRFDEPDLAILEIREELCILGGIELAGPKNFGAVDFRSVVNPLVVQIVILIVAHHDQVLAGSLCELFLDSSAARFSLAGPSQIVADAVLRGEANVGCEEKNDGPGERGAKRSAAWTNRAQVANRLDEQ